MATMVVVIVVVTTVVVVATVVVAETMACLLYTSLGASGARIACHFFVAGNNNFAVD